MGDYELHFEYNRLEFPEGLQKMMSSRYIEMYLEEE